MPFSVHKYRVSPKAKCYIFSEKNDENVHIFLKHIINFVLLVKTIIAEAIDIS
jgi:hypothetical protein